MSVLFDGRSAEDVLGDWKAGNMMEDLEGGPTLGDVGCSWGDLARLEPEFYRVGCEHYAFVDGLHVLVCVDDLFPDDDKVTFVKGYARSSGRVSAHYRVSNEWRRPIIDTDFVFVGPRDMLDGSEPCGDMEREVSASLIRRAFPITRPVRNYKPKV